MVSTSWDLVEVLRTKNLVTPRTFPEASVVAKERYKARALMSAVKDPAISIPTLETPGNRFAARFPSQSSQNSFSPCNVLPTSPEYSFSSPGSIMGQIGSSLEGQVSRQVDKLTLADSKNCSIDSFSSDPSTDPNRGSLAFLELVEKSYREE